MMKKFIMSFMMVGVLFVCDANAQELKKVDHFSVLVDQSGSMYMKHDCCNTKKIVLAKEALKNVMENVPNLNYESKVSLVCEDEVLHNQKYNKDAVLTKISRISEDKEIFGRTTNLSDVFVNEEKNVLNARKSVVLLVTDGEWNDGEDPVIDVENLYASRNDVVVHVISLADSLKGSKTISEIASLNPDTYVVGVHKLLNKEYAKEFAEDIFFTNYTPIEVFFAFGCSDVTDEENIRKFQALDALYDHAVIEGCACEIGDVMYNKVLSTKRAENVAKIVGTHDFYGSGICNEHPKLYMNRHAKIYLK